MPVDHREQAFEAAIEDCLLTRGGYAKADPENFDRERAIDPTVFIPFLKDTQPETWQALEKLHGANTAAVILDDLTKALDGTAGALAVIRHGFKCFGKLIRVAYFAPGGYKTAYLWEQVWQRDSWLDILARFMHLQVEEKTVAGKTKRTERLIFPRYHQLTAVRRLEADARRVVAARAHAAFCSPSTPPKKGRTIRRRAFQRAVNPGNGRHARRVLGGFNSAKDFDADAGQLRKLFLIAARVHAVASDRFSCGCERVGDDGLP
ncbi:MAG: hypothetical protein V2A79_11725 [Planctomycetota bacterium]